ncbi:MAG: hypothetical protein AAGF49_04940 [Pseudomonadota bacterium]
MQDEELLLRLSHAHLEGGGYERFVNLLRDSSPGIFYMLQAENLRPRTLNTASVPGGPPEMLEDFAKVVHVNPMTDLSRQPGGRFPVNRAFCTEEYVSREEMRRSRYHAEFGSKWEGLTSSVGFVIRHGRDGFLVLAGTLRDGVADEQRDGLLTMMERIRRPVCRSFRFAAALHRRGLFEGQRRTLDAIATPAALFDGEGRLAYANPPFETLCDGKVLKTVPNGGVVAGVVQNGRQIEDAVVSVLSTRIAYGPVRLSRPGPVPLVLYAAPLSSAERPSLLEAYDDVAPTVALFVFDPLETEGHRADALKAVLGLTGAEAELAALLAAGRTLNEAASERGVTRATARNQLAAINSKLGISRQSELVSLLARIPSGLG